MQVVNPPNVNLSQIVVDAGLDLSGGDYDIAMKAGRTVDGKDVSGLGGGAGDMEKSVYDPDNTGKIELKVLRVASNIFYEADKQIKTALDTVTGNTTTLTFDDPTEYIKTNPTNVEEQVISQVIDFGYKTGEHGFIKWTCELKMPNGGTTGYTYLYEDDVLLHSFSLGGYAGYTPKSQDNIPVIPGSHTYKIKIKASLTPDKLVGIQLTKLYGGKKQPIKLVEV